MCINNINYNPNHLLTKKQAYSLDGIKILRIYRQGETKQKFVPTPYW